MSAVSWILDCMIIFWLSIEFIKRFLVYFYFKIAWFLHLVKADFICFLYILRIIFYFTILLYSFVSFFHFWKLENTPLPKPVIIAYINLVCFLVLILSDLFLLNSLVPYMSGSTSPLSFSLTFPYFDIFKFYLIPSNAALW